MFFRFIIGWCVFCTWVVLSEPEDSGKWFAKAHKAYTSQMLK